MPQFVPITQDALVERLVEHVRTLPGYRVLAIDGADAAHPADLAHRTAAALHDTGRPAEVVSLHDYVRPASLRMEYGVDEISYRTAWFDYEALRREVIDALHTDGRWLPALWNETTDRSARAPIRPALPDTVLVIAGPMLLNQSLPFDVTVHLAMSEPALRRSTPPEDHWTIPALLETPTAPTFFIRWDHPARPALRLP
ncbi:hypothetical protein [Nocardia ninae]|uniref:Uridine kinase n=2 Tax=Nocardia ninae TaxID=356145 RepID=A0A511MNE8_9NOCA|nr:hypothetical protein [Nocardia ninae]GEM41486.1 hypothetical protein NN4_60050 [Nocardia ninae NBRC 108245]